MFNSCRGGSAAKATSGASAAALSAERLTFPFDCESPFLFAVYHLDRYPAGNANMGPDASLRGRNIGSDFNNPSGWSMYHGDSIPGFPKHPHRGFETITITRQGVIDHTDSMGNAGRFGFGDVQWMTAGAGVWINLPKRTKMSPPSFKMLWAENLPAPQTSGPPGSSPEVALIAGNLSGFDSPPAPPPDSYASDPASDVLIVTVKLPAGTSWTLPRYEGPGAAEGLHRNAYFYSGKQADVGGARCSDHKKVKLRPDVDAVFTAGAAGPAEILVLQGRDIGEPVVQHGPFVGNSRADIAKAFQDYQSTNFGGWPWPSDALAHPRDRPRFAKYSDGRSEEMPMPA